MVTWGSPLVGLNVDLNAVATVLSIWVSGHVTDRAIRKGAEDLGDRSGGWFERRFLTSHKWQFRSW